MSVRGSISWVWQVQGVVPQVVQAGIVTQEQGAVPQSGQTATQEQGVVPQSGQTCGVGQEQGSVSQSGHISSFGSQLQLLQTQLPVQVSSQLQFSGGCGGQAVILNNSIKIEITVAIIFFIFNP